MIRVDGGYERGLGHVVRMRALASGLAERGWQVMFCTASDAEARRVLQESRLPIAEIEYSSDGYVPEQTLERFAPDVIVLDILDTERRCLDGLRKSSDRKLVVFDDLGAGLELADIVINAIVFHQKKTPADSSRATLYEGPDYIVLSRGITDLVGQDPTERDDVSRLLIAFGGSDSGNVTPKALAAVQSIRRPLRIDLNLGPAARDLDAQAVAEHREDHTVAIHRNGVGFQRLMAAADLVICAGGIMLYELAALGVPAAAVAAEAHEIDNIAYWTNAGTAIDLGAAQDFDPPRAAAAVASLLDDAPRRRRMSENGRRRVDGQGLRRCIGIFEELVH